MTTDPENDDPEFEAYLRRRSVLSARGQFEEKIEPPGELDAIVLRKAREAIGDAERTVVHRAPRWAVPVALAATILLCLSIVLNVELNTGKQTAVGARVTQEVAPGAEAPAPSVAPEPSDAPAPAAEASRGGVRAVPPPFASAAPARPVAPLPETAPASDALVAQETARSTAALRKSADAAAPAAPTDPKAWLGRIAALRTAGKNTQADAELRRFRAAFPAYPVSPPPPTPSDPPK